MTNPTFLSGFTAITVASAAAVISALLILALLPMLRRYALARPNARSSHTIPTAQGAGIAVIAATLACVVAAFAYIGRPLGFDILILGGASLVLAVLGGIDDIRPVPVLPRLLIQLLIIGTTIAAMPADLRLFDALPLWAERALVVVAGLWFINLVNFMDGLDWMSVAEIIPVAAVLAVLGLWGRLSWEAGALAAALCGAMIGFAPFNRHVAKVFLGDVGSLPIGLIVGWCLLDLAGHGYFVAAVLLPLYYLADGTATLLMRIKNREQFWVAHRTHFYQHATINGFSVPLVTGYVFALNIALAGLALMSAAFNSVAINMAGLFLGAGAVYFVLWQFSHKQPLKT